MSCWTFWDPWTVAQQALLCMEFSRQEYWSGQPFPSPGDLPDLGLKPSSPALQAHSLPSEPASKVMLKNLSSQTSIVFEQRTSRCISRIQKRQRNQRSNCQQPLDHRKSKRTLEKNIYSCFIVCTKVSTVWITTNCEKCLQRWEYQTT